MYVSGCKYGESKRLKDLLKGLLLSHETTNIKRTVYWMKFGVTLWASSGKVNCPGCGMHSPLGWDREVLLAALNMLDGGIS